MSDPYPRIKALLERAVHEGTPPAEASSCAMIACREIVKHDLLAFTPASTSTNPIPGAPAGDLAARLAEAERVNVRLSHALEQAKATIVSVRAMLEKVRAEGPAKGEGIVEITSAWEGSCRVCGSPYAEGEKVAWQRGKGAVHVRCRPRWEKRR